MLKFKNISQFLSTLVNQHLRKIQILIINKFFHFFFNFNAKFKTFVENPVQVCRNFWYVG